MLLVTGAVFIAAASKWFKGLHAFFRSYLGSQGCLNFDVQASSSSLNLESPAAQYSGFISLRLNCQHPPSTSCPRIQLNCFSASLPPPRSPYPSSSQQSSARPLYPVCTALDSTHFLKTWSRCRALAPPICLKKKSLVSTATIALPPRPYGSQLRLCELLGLCAALADFSPPANANSVFCLRSAPPCGDLDENFNSEYVGAGFNQAQAFDFENILYTSETDTLDCDFGTKLGLDFNWMIFDSFKRCLRLLTNHEATFLIGLVTDALNDAQPSSATAKQHVPHAIKQARIWTSERSATKDIGGVGVERTIFGDWGLGSY
ncbi:hypothetical protein DFH06DRAFT_1290646 [Mycena polygramma]|nr:hypothetical protein DFH06DRAFT_1290646 [Mycena polygramma]